MRLIIASQGLFSRIVPVVALAVVVAFGATWNIDSGEAAPASRCGECTTYDLSLSYHDFAECEQMETHDGDCGCGGSECHLAIVQGKCDGSKGCGHGNCPPPQDDEDLAVALQEAGGSAACLSSEQLGRIVDNGDAGVIAELVSMFPGSVLLNQDRQALQVLNCAGLVAVHVPLPDSFFDSVVLELN